MALDIAIAVADKNQAAYLLDFGKAVGPIQRWQLFQLGLGEQFENQQRAQDRTATIFPEMAQKYYLANAQENLDRMTYLIESEHLSYGLDMGSILIYWGAINPMTILWPMIIVMLTMRHSCNH